MIYYLFAAKIMLFPLTAKHSRLIIEFVLAKSLQLSSVEELFRKLLQKFSAHKVLDTLSSAISELRVWESSRFCAKMKHG